MMTLDSFLSKDDDNVLFVVSEETKPVTAGMVRKVTFSCGCIVYFCADYLEMSVKHHWIRCEIHEHSDPDKLIVVRK